MATLTSRSTFNEANMTAAKTAIAAYVTGIYNAAVSGQGAITMTLNINVVATDDTDDYTYSMRLTIRASVYSTLTTNLDFLLDELDDIAEDSGDFDLVTSVSGTVKLELTYT